MRIKYGFWIILMGFLLIALITAASILKWNDVTSVATVIGATTSLVGTVVGSFLGVQVGAAGKERVEADRKQSEETARIALSMLPPEVAIQVQEDVGSRGRPTS
jgi:inner membrane protein involved in colicin E2 resistance